MTALADRLRSLEMANDVRMTVAAFKRDLGLLGQRDALLETAQVLRENPERVRAVRIHVLLECVPGLGSARVRRILTRPGFPIWPLRTVGELSERQRRVIADELSRLTRSSPVPGNRILLFIESGGGPVFSSDIASELGLSHRGMAGRMIGLARRGFVRKVMVGSVPRRERCGWVLTDAGRDALSQPAPERRREEA